MRSLRPVILSVWLLGEKSQWILSLLISRRSMFFYAVFAANPALFIDQVALSNLTRKMPHITYSTKVLATKIWKRRITLLWVSWIQVWPARRNT